MNHNIDTPEITVTEIIAILNAAGLSANETTTVNASGDIRKHASIYLIHQVPIKALRILASVKSIMAGLPTSIEFLPANDRGSIAEINIHPE